MFCMADFLNFLNKKLCSCVATPVSNSRGSFELFKIQFVSLKCFYIESFSRRSYPERHTVVSVYIFIFFFLHILVLRGNRTHNPGVATAMLHSLCHTGTLWSAIRLLQHITCILFKAPFMSFVAFYVCVADGQNDASN